MCLSVISHVCPASAGSVLPYWNHSLVLLTLIMSAGFSPRMGGVPPPSGSVAPRVDEYNCAPQILLNKPILQTLTCIKRYS